MTLEQVLQAVEKYYQNKDISHSEVLRGLRQIAELANDYADISEADGES